MINNTRVHIYPEKLLLLLHVKVQNLRLKLNKIAVFEKEILYCVTMLYPNFIRDNKGVRFLIEHVDQSMIS